MDTCLKHWKKNTVNPEYYTKENVFQIWRENLPFKTDQKKKKKNKKEKNYYQTCTKIKVKKLPQQKDYDTNHICMYTHTQNEDLQI